MIEREAALKLVKERVGNQNLINHMLAVEAIMRGLAKHFSEDEEIWGLTGLLHDVDYTSTEGSPERHTMVTEDILSGQVSDEVIRAIKTHNSEHTGVLPVSSLEKALIVTDSLSGLLIACALVQPSNKIRDVKVKSVKKKFKQKDFARAVKRERIMMCEEIGLERAELYEIGIESLKKISDELGL
jgi:putative nucleotidyltransferase with HDIG domain